jgi:hypothetical protein
MSREYKSNAAPLMLVEPKSRVSRFIRLKAKRKEIFIAREEKSIGLVSTAKLPKKENGKQESYLLVSVARMP